MYFGKSPFGSSSKLSPLELILLFNPDGSDGK